MHSVVAGSLSSRRCAEAERSPVAETYRWAREPRARRKATEDPMARTSVLVVAALLVFCGSLSAQRPNTVSLDELTWTEVRQAIDEGTTTVIVATAGTEQNGPHIGARQAQVHHQPHLGAHRARARRRARGAGDRLRARGLPRSPHRPHALRGHDHSSQQALHEARRVHGEEPGRSTASRTSCSSATAGGTRAE